MFDAKGEQTQYRWWSIKLLTKYQAHFTQPQSFCDRLKIDLLEPVTATYEIAGANKMSLGGFFAVNRQK